MHRDLKPNNLLLTGDGTLKLSDFGIARGDSAEDYLTLSGDQIGSVLYISRRQRESPEQAGRADDGYAVCCCLYEILSRTRIHLAPPDLYELTGGRIPRYICELIMGCLAGADGELILDHLSECFTRTHDGQGGVLTPLATSSVLNGNVHVLQQHHKNAGLTRRRFADTAPVSRIAEISLPPSKRDSLLGRDDLLAFVDDDTIAVVSRARHDDEFSSLRLFTHHDDSWEQAAAGTVIPADAVAAFSSRRILVCGHEQLAVYDIIACGVPVLAKTWDLTRNCRVKRSATSYSCREVLMASGGTLALLSVASLSRQPLFLAESIDWDLPNFCFIGDGMFAASCTGFSGVIIGSLGTSGAASVRHRMPMPKEVFTLSASPDGRVLFVGTEAHLAAIAVEDGVELWRLPFPVSEVLVSPCGRFLLAVHGGLLGANDLAVVDVDGQALGDLEPSRGGGRYHWSEPCWSPSGARLAAAEASVIYVFESRRSR